MTYGTFNFTYPFAGEIDGRCMVNYYGRYHPPHLLIELREDGEWAEPTGLLRAEIDKWLWENREDSITQFQPRALEDRNPRESWA